MNNNVKRIISDYWLFMLIAAQPVLDIVAYWSRGGNSTLAGYIRLAIMLILPLHLLFTLKKKRNFILIMFAIGAVCALHVMNTFRIGAVNFVYDVSYIARMAQAPILAVCFCYYIKDEKMKQQAIKGIVAAMLINFAAILLALVTNTWNSTYGGGVGLSGWVIDDNRCANSIIFVSLSTFAVYVASVSERKFFNIGIPIVVWALLIANGTKACYMALFAILIGYAAFMLFRRLVTGEKIKKCFVLTLVVLAVLAVLVYPVSPRYIVDEALRNTRGDMQSEIDLKLIEMGYDPYSMTLEEKLNTPEVRAVFEEYYLSIMEYIIPELFSRFGMERVLIHYNMTSDMEYLINTRIMKRAYAQFIWEDTDSITKFTGFDISDICRVGSYDLENDYHAIYYYTGYIGLAAYCVYLLFFIYKVIKRLFTDFKGSMTMLNFCLLLSIVLQLGLAHFSGSVLRRPNVSVYVSLVQALLFYQCTKTPGKVQMEADI